MSNDAVLSDLALSNVKVLAQNDCIVLAQISEHSIVELYLPKKLMTTK